MQDLINGNGVFFTYFCDILFVTEKFDFFVMVVVLEFCITVNGLAGWLANKTIKKDFNM